MFFSSKPKEAKLSYRVYFTKLVKYQQLIHYLNENRQQHLLLYYFDQTGEELNALIEAAHLPHCQLACAFDFTKQTGSIILAEVHPLESEMKRLLKKFDPTDSIPTYIGMDEVLLKAFGSDKTVLLMEKLGMEPNEAISHRMVDQSIDNAMKKLTERLKHPVDSRTSAEDWAKANGIV